MGLRRCSSSSRVEGLSRGQGQFDSMGTFDRSQIAYTAQQTTESQRRDRSICICHSDDSAGFVKLLTASLAAAGFQVLTSANPEPIDTLPQFSHAAARKTPKVVMLVLSNELLLTTQGLEQLQQAVERQWGRLPRQDLLPVCAGFSADVTDTSSSVGNELLLQLQQALSLAPALNARAL